MKGTVRAQHAGPESTASLLTKVRAGDDEARTRLVVRYTTLLRRWAHGRLPPQARHLADTDDFVQLTLIRALDGVKTFEPRREGAFLAYLRTILMNEIRGAVRRVSSGLEQDALPADLRDGRPSPLEEAIGAEAMGGPSEDAARMLVARAIARLSEAMVEHARR